MKEKSVFYVILFLGPMTLKFAWLTIFVLVIVHHINYIHKIPQFLISKIQKAIKNKFSLFIWCKSWHEMTINEMTCGYSWHLFIPVGMNILTFYCRNRIVFDYKVLPHTSQGCYITYNICTFLFQNSKFRSTTSPKNLPPPTVLQTDKLYIIKTKYFTENITDIE